MLLHKSALRTLLSDEETIVLANWKKRIHTSMSDEHPQNTLDFLQHVVRPSGIFKTAYMTCSNCDLGHYAAQCAIHSSNIKVLVFLIEHNFMMLKQGSIVLCPEKLPGTVGTTSNVYEEDEPYMFTAIMYGNSASVATLLEHGVAANGMCQNTTFLSLAVQRWCECRHDHADAVAKIQLLLMYAADPLATDALGCTSFTVLCRNAHSVSLYCTMTGTPCNIQRNVQKQISLSRLLDHLILHIMKPSIDLGESAAWHATVHTNPLQTPANNGNTWLMWLLFNRGVCIDTVNESGQNALFVGKSAHKRTSRGVRGSSHGHRATTANTATPKNPRTLATRQAAAHVFYTTTPIASLQFLVTHGIDVARNDIYDRTPIIHLLLQYPYSDKLHEKLWFFFKSGVDIKHTCTQKNSALSLSEALARQNTRLFEPIAALVRTMLILHEQKQQYHQIQ
jgi:hypothetical protein